MKELEVIIKEMDQVGVSRVMIQGESISCSNIGNAEYITSEDREFLKNQAEKTSGSNISWYTDEMPEGKNKEGQIIYKILRYEVTSRRESEGGSSKKVISKKYCYYAGNGFKLKENKVYCNVEDIVYAPMPPKAVLEKLGKLKSSLTM